MKPRGGSLRIGWILALLAPLICCLPAHMWIDTVPRHAGWLLTDPRAFGMLILVYPVIEELSFRGVIQGILLHGTRRREWIGGITVANAVTSVLFVAIHFVHHPPLWAVAVWVPSLIFGYFRDRYGSVMPAVGLHMFYNLVFYSMVGR